MRMTIGKKLFFSNLGILVILLAVGTFSILALNNVSSQYDLLLNDRMEKVSLIKEIKGAQKDSTSHVFDHLLTSTDASKRAVIENEEATQKLTSELKDGITDPVISDKLIEFEKKLNVFITTNQTIIAAKAAKDQATINTMTANSKNINLTMLSILEDVEKYLQDEMNSTKADLMKNEQSIRSFIFIICLIGIVLGIVLAYVINRSITRPIIKVTESLKEIANGNLTVSLIHIKSKDESGDMAAAFNKMTEDLRVMVTNVKDSSMQLAANAEELSAGAEQSLASSQLVARSAGEQVASTDSQMHHMDSSVNGMKELTDGISHISTSNEGMLHSTQEVKGLVGTGSEVVASVANHMNTIHSTIHETASIVTDMAKHSNEIQSITALISEISEQTNLLSLNAAIEAARAGEYGKGFAVVAEEVRKLAEQSKKSATEIDKMIQVIQASSNKAVQAIKVGGEKVEQGIIKTDESLQVFNQIENAVLDVGEKVDSVASAIDEIQQIATVVSEGSIEVQRLASIVADGANDTSAATEEQLAVNEEITANAQSLANLAEALQNSISHFKI